MNPFCAGEETHKPRYLLNAITNNAPQINPMINPAMNMIPSIVYPFQR